MRLFLFLTLLGGLLVLSSPVPAWQEPPPLGDQPVYWEGSLTRRGHRGARRGLAFGFDHGANELSESTLKVRLQEVWDGPDANYPRLRLEQGTWNSKVSDLYYENDDNKIALVRATAERAAGYSQPIHSTQKSSISLTQTRTPPKYV